MNSRDRILSRLKEARVSNNKLPEIVESVLPDDLRQQLTSVLQGIGGTVVTTSSLKDITSYLLEKFKPAGRWISMVKDLDIPGPSLNGNPHELENVQVSIFHGHFAVAENGAVWITSDLMGDRALPFICEHIAVVVGSSDIVPTMRHAYDRIGNSSQDFGTFIAGPSKTADIEQSLVLGAHGPKSLTLFLVS
ncbi:LUD domain-containing protein [Chryseolinea sp. T2]|uniref:LutC/YkgG family protein n=1 Tax=Chryseolinea sp. T2 TaxID=3129255 RepID=UPI0030771218